MICRLTDRRGFALPVVILIVALLTVLLTSGLTRARAERQIADASDETAAALAVAQSGLQTYLGTVTARPADGDSTRINVTGGYANVVTYVVRIPGDTSQRSLYLVRATGFVINPDSGASPRAVRTVAQFAEWETGYMLPRAALTTANGLHVEKQAVSTFKAWGVDACSAQPTLPGARTSTYIEEGPPSLYPDTLGNPGMIFHGSSTGPMIANQTHINWAGALGADLTPDYTTFQNGSTTYPIQRVSGDLSVSGAGSGILVVPGDLTIPSGAVFIFRGILLVGGKLDVTAWFVQIRGLVVTGLNEQLGINPQATRIRGQSFSAVYNSCEVANALAALTGLAPVRNAWLDNWATY